jgi:hypothetical protein
MINVLHCSQRLFQMYFCLPLILPNFACDRPFFFFFFPEFWLFLLLWRFVASNDQLLSCLCTRRKQHREKAITRRELKLTRTRLPGSQTKIPRFPERSMHFLYMDFATDAQMSFCGEKNIRSISL